MTLLSGESRPETLAPAVVADAYEDLRAMVLTEVSRRGVDLSDHPAVRALAAEVVAGYQTQARAGLGGRALADPAA
ncbi:MAG: hypothetical protein M3Q48_18070, partial [Actinomycetota bacterium]|nr:hypothetical protein [Actinomycetota bacterium]